MGIRVPQLLVRQAPFLLAGTGVVCGALVGFLLPGTVGLASGIAIVGGSMIGAALKLDGRLQQQLETLSAAVGEVKVRLAMINMRLDGLAQRLDQKPMSEADAAPARATIAELTAEVGILGGLLKDVADTLADHEQRLDIYADKDGEAVAPVMSAPASGGTALVAERNKDIEAAQIKATEARTAAILEAIAQSRVEIYLQPVVNLPQRKTRGYEALVRLRLDADTLLLPAEFMSIVEARGLGSTLDAMVLTRTLAIARYLASKPDDLYVTCNLSSTTWSEPRAIASIARLLENYRNIIPHFVMEIPQRVFRSLEPATLGLLGGMSAHGMQFALDQVGDLRFDTTALWDRGIRMVKVPAALLLSEAAQGGKPDIAVSDLSAYLSRGGITLVAEKIENDRTVADIIELDVSAAQGFVFSPPRPVKADVFNEPAPVEETAEAEMDETRLRAGVDASAIEGGDPVAEGGATDQSADGEERKPFRSFLRRATA